MKVSELTEKLRALAPEELKEDWDNVGLLSGHGDAEITGVLISLDPSLPALREAKTLGYNLLLTHHPILFGAIRSLADDTVTAKALLFAAENGIACVNLHTNLDSVSGGVGDLLAEKLGIRNAAVLFPCGKDAFCRDYGYVRGGTIEPCPCETFARRVKELLSCTGIRCAFGSKTAEKVAVGGGACADELYAVRASGYDTFVTADVKYHQFRDACELGLTLIDAGHFETENPVCEKLLSFLENSCPELDVRISVENQSPIRYL